MSRLPHPAGTLLAEIGWFSYPIIEDEPMHTTTANEIHEDNRLSAETPVNEETRMAIRHHYPASAFRGPLFEGRDRIALALAAIMMLGPLGALPLGYGG
jgi:hypothetical protein